MPLDRFLLTENLEKILKRVETSDVVLKDRSDILFGKIKQEVWPLGLADTVCPAGR